MRTIARLLSIATLVTAVAAQGQEPASDSQIKALEKRIARLEDRLAEGTKSSAALSNAASKLRIGGYGDLHANFTQGSEGGDQTDLHRLVFYLGYEFNDWIQFHSETEVEHAYVTSGAGGEVVIEQAYFDVLLHPAFNIRAGRVLTPLGIINETHEPTAFNSVERPAFAKVIIPSTWSVDGIGIFGELMPNLSYKLYHVTGLDGSGFSAKDGIRGGRIKERPSFHESATTGRLDYLLAWGNGSSRSLRVGVSGFFGGIDNGNKGSDPGVRGDVEIYAADFDLKIDRAYVRGEAAKIYIDDAALLGGGVASEIGGWYLEVGADVLPAPLRRGKLDEAKAIVFVRYEDYDTQADMPSGVDPDPAGDRQDWVVGVNFMPTPKVAFKVDYQERNDKSPDNLDGKLNVGIGFTF